MRRVWRFLRTCRYTYGLLLWLFVLCSVLRGILLLCALYGVSIGVLLFFGFRDGVILWVLCNFDTGTGQVWAFGASCVDGQIKRIGVFLPVAGLSRLVPFAFLGWS